MLPYWGGGGVGGSGGGDDGDSGDGAGSDGDSSDGGRSGDGGGEVDGGLSHQFLPYPRHYHWCFLLFLSVMLFCKINIENVRDIR